MEVGTKRLPPEMVVSHLKHVSSFTEIVVFSFYSDTNQREKGRFCFSLNFWVRVPL